MKYIGIVFTVLMIISCKTNKMSLEVDSIIEKDSNMSNNKYSNKDTILQFKCGPFNQSIKAENLDWVHFNNNLGKCLLKNGFNGDISANLQIAEIIRFVKMDGFDVFPTNPKFRGSEVFEAFLDISANDFSPAVDFDGNKSETMSNSESFAHYYLEMIVSIRGLTYSDYVNNIYHTHPFVNQEYVEGKGFNYDFYLELWQLVLNGIKQAWAEGKIVLKPYGVK